MANPGAESRPHIWQQKEFFCFSSALELLLFLAKKNKQGCTSFPGVEKQRIKLDKMGLKQLVAMVWGKIASTLIF